MCFGRIQSKLEKVERFRRMWSEFEERGVSENGMIWKNSECIRGKWSGLEEFRVNLKSWQKQVTVLTDTLKLPVKALWF